MVISRGRFAEKGKEMYRNKKKHVKGVQSFCFCSFNMQNLWRCRCRRVVDLKIPNVGGCVISSRRQQLQQTLYYNVSHCVYWLSSLSREIFSCFKGFPLSSQTSFFKSKLHVETVGDKGILLMSIAEDSTQQTSVACFHCFPYAYQVT